jgi:hypothetical protein
MVGKGRREILRFIRVLPPGLMDEVVGRWQNTHSAQDDSLFFCGKYSLYFFTALKQSFKI